MLDTATRTPVQNPTHVATDSRSLTYLQAITEALDQEMARDTNVFILGEDVGGEFGGAFNVTQGLAAKYGDRRVMNTPMSELGFTGMATGMAMMGLRPVIEVQFADFITTAFDAIVQYAATTHYIWQAAVPWTIRAPADGGTRSGPFHSQNPEAWFAHVPGLKVICPGTPADAKGLLVAAIRDNNPVVYFENKTLYRSLKGPVPAGEYLIPIGEAHRIRAGDDISVITYGAQLQEALRAADQLETEGVTVDVLDLRTIKPLDTDRILATARRTGKVLIVHSANRLMGVGAEVAALIAEQAFEYLDAPVQRLGGLDVPVPFSPPLEDAYRPGTAKILAAARDLLAY